MFAQENEHGDPFFETMAATQRTPSIMAEFL